MCRLALALDVELVGDFDVLAQVLLGVMRRNIVGHQKLMHFHVGFKVQQAADLGL